MFRRALKSIPTSIESARNPISSVIQQAVSTSVCPLSSHGVLIDRSSPRNKGWIHTSGKLLSRPAQSEQMGKHQPISTEINVPLWPETAYTKHQGQLCVNTAPSPKTLVSLTLRVPNYPRRTKGMQQNEGHP